MPPAQLQFLPCSAHQFHFCPSPNKQRQYLFSPENVYAELHSGLRVGSPKILSSQKIVSFTNWLLPTKSCAFFPSHIFHLTYWYGKSSKRMLIITENISLIPWFCQLGNLSTRSLQNIRRCICTLPWMLHQLSLWSCFDDMRYNPNIHQILPRYCSRWETGGISHISAHKIYVGISHIMRIWEQVYLVLASRAGDTGCGHDVELSSLVAISWQRSN